MIGQVDMRITLADPVDTIANEQQSVLPEHGQELSEYTPLPHPPALTSRLHTAEPHPWPQTPETHPLNGLEHLGRIMSLKPHLMVPTPRGADSAGITSHADVDQKLHSESAGVNSLPTAPLLVFPLPYAYLPEVHLNALISEE